MPPREALARELAELARLRRARDKMDREFESELDVEGIARTARMSPAHFSRRFKQEYGESPYSYLMTRRIERAMALLRRGDLSVTEVCMAVGCSSLGSFSSNFKRLVGLSPSEYRSLEHQPARALPACIEKEHTRPHQRPAQPAARSRDVAGRAGSALVEAVSVKPGQAGREAERLDGARAGSEKQS